MTAAQRRPGAAAARLAPALLVVVVLFGGALVGAVTTSLTPLGRSASLDTWRALLEDPVFGDAVWFTLKVATVSTAVSALLALGLAWLVQGRGTSVRAAFALPVPVPHLLVATLAVLWLGPGGLADRLAGGLPFTIVRDEAGLGVIAVYVYKEAPFLMLLVLAALGRGHADRAEAAAALGASPVQRLAWVTWPTVRGPLVIGSIIAFAYAAGAFEVPLLVGPSYPPTIAEYARQATQADLLAGQGTAAAALLVAAGLSVALASLAVRAARDVQGD